MELAGYRAAGTPGPEPRQFKARISNIQSTVARYPRKDFVGAGGLFQLSNSKVAEQALRYFASDIEHLCASEFGS